MILPGVVTYGFSIHQSDIRFIASIVGKYLGQTPSTQRACHHIVRQLGNTHSAVGCPYQPYTFIDIKMCLR